jgi:hypothetical protein
MEFISHCVKRDPGKLQGRATIGMLIILSVLSLLGWIYLTQASYVATTSRQVQELESEKVRLQQENLELMAEIAEFESVDRLSVRAKEMGFVAVTPDDADFVAVVEAPPVESPGTGLQDVDSRSSSEASQSTRWLNGVTDQFTAWVRAEVQ